ncbi:MAG: serine protease [Myxococcales bacterium]|nr:MAG: serine protease [Myxococcales bacterium]
MRRSSLASVRRGERSRRMAPCSLSERTGRSSGVSRRGHPRRECHLPTLMAARRHSATTPTRIGWRRRLAAGLAITAAAAVGCGDVPDATSPLGSLGEGVARVEVVWRDAGGVRRSRAFGTAFRVGSQGELLTAHHVAANARTQLGRFGRETRARIHVAFAPTGPEPGSDADASLSIEVAIAAEDPDADLALLQSVGPQQEGGEGSASRGPAGDIARGSAARLASAQPPAESAVAVVGYPIGEPDLVVRTGRLLDTADLADAPAASDPLRSWLDTHLRDGSVLLADVETRLGNSGAPIYLLESGEIIGLCSAVLLRNQLTKGELIPLPHPPGATITVIITAQRIQSFLAAHRASAR